MKFLCEFETTDEVQPVDVITNLVQSKYRLISQRQESASLIKVMVEAPPAKSQEVIVEELGQVPAKLVSLAFADPGKETKKEKREREKRERSKERSLRRAASRTTVLDITDESSALAMIGSQYPNIASSVLAYRRCLPAAQTGMGLEAIGRKVGASVYQRDYSLGSPLKLMPAISRELRPALKEFCDVSGDELDVRLAGNPFCRGTAEESCCDFVVGYMFGFLSSNPAVEFDSIERLSCGANSGGACTFTILPS